MKQFLVSLDLLQKILNYLAEKPFKEVQELIQTIVLLKPVPEEEEEKV